MCQDGVHLSVSSTNGSDDVSEKTEETGAGQPHLAQLRNSYTGAEFTSAADASIGKDRSRSEHRLKYDLDRERRLRLLEQTERLSAIKKNVAGADPEYQPILRNNVIISGGGSLIEGLAARIADEIADIGDVNVWCIEDPIEKVATGALALAEQMPDEMFTSIN